jgi:hypothetical protein
MYLIPGSILGTQDSETNETMPKTLWNSLYVWKTDEEMIQLLKSEVTNVGAIDNPQRSSWYDMSKSFHEEMTLS